MAVLRSHRLASRCACPPIFARTVSPTIGAPRSLANTVVRSRAGAADRRGRKSACSCPQGSAGARSPRALKSRPCETRTFAQHAWRVSHFSLLNSARTFRTPAVLAFVPVVLLVQQGEWWRRHNQVNRIVLASLAEGFRRIPGPSHAVRRLVNDFSHRLTSLAINADGTGQATGASEHVLCRTFVADR
jgi:hypothetical protein